MDITNQVKRRLNEFTSFRNKDPEEWFSELCFCILTANSKAITAISIQEELGPEGFIECAQSGLSRCIRRNKHRFHNNKAKYIVEAREHLDVKNKVNNLVKDNGQIHARNWLAENIKGIGYKEASHFMRNVGYFDVAILDRHILNLMVEKKILMNKPKTLNKKLYHEIESIFSKMAKRRKMSLAELDLRMWYEKTGKVLK